MHAHRPFSFIVTPWALAAAVALCTATLGGQAPAASTDWPQWRGPERTGISHETGLLKQWPPSGPAALWSGAGLGNGYGSIAVKGNQLFVQGLKGRDSVVTSLGRADGKVLWTRVIGPGRDNDRGPGPRSTPTVDGDLAVRADRERRPGRTARHRRRRGLAAQHPARLQRPEHLVAPQ